MYQRNKKTVNRFRVSGPNRLSRYFTGTAIGGLLLGLVSGCDIQKTDAEYITEVKNLLAQSQDREALIELKNALQSNPENAEARYLLAKVYLRSQVGAGAEKELAKAIEFGYSADELADELTLAFFYQHKYGELLKQTRRLNIEASPEEPMIRFYRGLSSLYLLNTPDAYISFEKAHKSAPQSAYGKLAKAYLQTYKEKDPAQGLASVSALLNDTPDIAEGHVLAMKLYEARKSYPEAISHLEKIVAIEPKRLSLYVDAAKLYLANEDREQAEKYIDRVLKSAPTHQQSLLLKAGLFIDKKDWKGAKLYADKALSVGRDSSQAKLLSGIAEFYLRNWETSHTNLSAVVDKLPDNHVARRMLAFVNYELGYYSDPQSVFDLVGGAQKGDEKILADLGNKLVNSGKVDDAFEMYERAAEIAPEDALAHAAVGMLKLHQNDRSGSSDLSAALKIRPSSFAARSALVKFHLLEKDFDSAFKLADETITQDPEKAEGYILLAAIHSTANHYDDAEKVLDSGLEKVTDVTAIRMAKAKLYFDRGRVDEAVKLVRDVIDKDPQYYPAFSVYYELLKKTGDTEPAFQLVNKAVNEGAEDTLKLMLSQIYSDRGALEKARSTLLTIGQESSRYIDAIVRLGNLEMSAGNYPAAFDYYLAWSDKEPDEIRAYQAQIGVLVKQGKFKAALEVIDKGLKALPTNQWLQINEVRFLFADGRQELAKRKKSKFVAKYGANAELALIEGKDYATRGDWKNAAKHLKIASDLQADPLTAILYYEALTQQGLNKAADEFLNQWSSKQPADLALQMYAASQALKSKQYSMAITLYKSMLAKNPENIVVLNNLASALAKDNQLSDALEYAERAYQLNPNIAAVVDTYGYLTLLNKDYSRAQVLLEKAYDALPDDPEIAYHYALSLKENKQEQRARAVLEPVLDKEFSEKAKAQALLQSLL
ncbi:XrtA/PEP-CTERM system TPR-repeat protein PrsT [Motiliproteus sp. MSK22-1]|uniref:XrtA/PEP-CTERM system TPR-repeat protein PrsT n=1 Tax=Motiliproteus sp. MSK22-1 TaxID=1897630 RepID=UPI0013017E44|nr:XrtA/PEP-CTERM system TPR-repeat protein PrsT [Motiliproteus sp. MSK22-1]